MYIAKPESANVTRINDKLQNTLDFGQWQVVTCYLVAQFEKNPPTFVFLFVYVRGVSGTQRFRVATCTYVRARMYWARAIEDYVQYYTLGEIF